MPSSIEVGCLDPAVRSAVRRWLDEGRLQPSIPLRVEITVGPVTSPPESDRRPIFRQPELTIRSGGLDSQVTISWDPWPAVAELGCGSLTAEVRLSPEAVERMDECLRRFLMTTLIFLLRRSDWHHVHGATAVDAHGRGWLLAGDSGAGKSTTAALLASRGWGVGTDDIAFLATSPGGKVEVHAFRTRLALRPGGEALLDRSGGLPLSGRGKTGFWPEELGGTWTPCIEPKILLFTRVGSDRTAVEPMRPRDTLAQLVRWSAWVALEPDLAQGHLDLLARLGSQATAYQVTLGRDLFTSPDLLTGLLP
jgi:hypothetical protein